MDKSIETPDHYTNRDSKYIDINLESVQLNKLAYCKGLGA